MNRHFIVCRRLLLPVVTMAVMLSAHGVLRAETTNGLLPVAFQLASFTDVDSNELDLLDSLAATTNVFPGQNTDVVSATSAARPESAVASGQPVAEGLFTFSRSVAPLLAPPSLPQIAAAGYEPMKGAAVGGWAEMKIRSPLRIR